MIAPDDPRLTGWYHTIELAPGVVTEGQHDHRPVLDRLELPPSLAGKQVLDVGAADGFFSFEFERRGAARVVALDITEWDEVDFVPSARPPAGTLPMRANFELAREHLGSRVEFAPRNVYALGPETVGHFDVVFCGSLLLHLWNPLLALVNMRSVTRELLILETAHVPVLEDEYSDLPLLRFGNREAEESTGAGLGATATYWAMNGAALRDLLAYAGFGEIRLLEPFELPPTRHPVIVAHARP